jgi:HK97 family phage major capsid protein
MGITNLKPRYFKADGDTDDLIIKASQKVTEIATEQKALKDTTTALQEKSREAQDRLLDLEQRMAGVQGIADRGGSGVIVGVSPAAEFMKAAPWEAFKQGAPDTGRVNLPLSIKALTSVQGSGETPAVGITVQADKIPGLHGVPIRPLGLFGALPHRQTASNSIEFEQLQAYSPAAGYQDHEGAEKPEQQLDPELKTAYIATIAVTQTSSRQVLLDETALTQSIDLRLRSDVLSKAEVELVNGPGGNMRVDGLLVQATPFIATAGARADQIGQTIADMAGRGYFPSVVVMHPTSWFEIQSERDPDGAAYVAGGWAAPEAPTVWGVPVVSTAAIAPGTILVIDARYVFIADREQVSVRVSEHHKDNFSKNLVTLLCEIRVGLVVLDPGAVVEVVAEESSSS